MAVHVYDPLVSQESQRPWRELLGAYTACEFAGGVFSWNGKEITEGIIIAHGSKLAEAAITPETVVGYCENRPAITLVVVSGGPPKVASALPNLYYRRTAVAHSQSDPFAKCFARFVAHLTRTNERVFRLLEPVLADAPTAVALAILCQGYLMARESRPQPGLGADTHVSQGVRETEWWLQPFGGIFPREAIRIELSRAEVPDAIEQLARAIEKANVRQALVEQALKALRDTFDETA